MDLFGPLSEGAEKFAQGLERVGDASEYAKEKSTSALATIGEMAHQQIGTIASGAFDAYAEAIDAAISTGEFSVKSLGAALRNMLSQTLRSIGQEAAVRGAFQVAEAIGALASVVTAWKAPGHFAAAAAYFGVAALAGAAAGALSTGGGGARTEPRNRDDSTGEGGGGSISQEVTIIGALDTRDAEMLDEQLATAREKRDLGS